LKNTQYKYNSIEWHQVLSGYAMGIFPMGGEDGSIAWYEASPRAIVPIENPGTHLKIPRSLKQIMNKDVFEFRIDTAFDEVISGCASRDSTWINPAIINSYSELHKRGYAHSVEAWSREDNKLAGGLYGVAYKGAFFGESMFHKKSNASKAAVVKLYEILKANKFVLLDIQMITPHLESLGAIEVSKRAYLEILEKAMSVNCEFKY
jgi:leucyl/phenylalanyl-tRNA--protein transferase